MSGRYAVFGGAVEYPRGGWADLARTTDSLDDARSTTRRFEGPFYWWQIVDLDTLTIVDEGDI